MGLPGADFGAVLRHDLSDTLVVAEHLVRLPRDRARHFGAGLVDRRSAISAADKQGHDGRDCNR
jgi:hypothetical protein